MRSLFKGFWRGIWLYPLGGIIIALFIFNPYFSSFVKSGFLYIPAFLVIGITLFATLHKIKNKKHSGDMQDGVSLFSKGIKEVEHEKEK